MADTDTTTALVLVWITMNPTVPSMAAGDLVTMWRRFAAVTVVVQVEAVRMLIDPRPLPARCLLFRRMVVAAVVAAVAAAVAADVAAVAAVAAAVAADDGESFVNREYGRVDMIGFNAPASFRRGEESVQDG
jgi:hypothetical protein